MEYDEARGFRTFWLNRFRSLFPFFLFLSDPDFVREDASKAACPMRLCDS